MLLHFYKYEGAGNDFIIIDNRSNKLVLDKENIVSLCLRHFGIGADGLMLLEGKTNDVDFVMKFFNPDGSSDMMCGNGGRCIVKFAFDMGVIKDKKTTFLAPDGQHNAEILADGNISLRMQDVNIFEAYEDGIWCNTGASHFVVACEDVENEDVYNKGKKLRNDNRFEKHRGANVNFYSKTDDNHLLIRTYERGVENETLACGTGITATALCYALKNNFADGQHTTNVATLYNSLQVGFLKKNDSFFDISLIGPATKVFEGDIVI